MINIIIKYMMHISTCIQSTIHTQVLKISLIIKTKNLLLGTTLKLKKNYE